jgi:hypothetical protein
MVGKPEVIAGHVLPGGLCEVSERKTSIFRPVKRRAPNVLKLMLSVSRFADGFPLSFS